ncbi:helix-turn-helix domain-containing protein [Piscinibacter terrae]|uniref:Helix-turn-helix domain-containing protein n=1 Tax=Piscinibacter terrae TaxID=2496871 RepID=A0A3N7IXV8_9BURK|nr:helix-turn-helix domain-containing protein [Albitalea terrae]RQP23592.1 helix-turn-helix domain-containing protein [Albitalea terrae]
MSDGIVGGSGGDSGTDNPAPAQAQTPRTAGAILREARQAQGLHIAALAASIKVAQKKLEALEADRLDELHDATFTRALAQTVCRALKIDPAPVLALLPAPTGHRLEQVGEGINAPFRDRPGRREPSDWSAVVRPAIWAPLLLLIAAVAVYLLPSGWLPSLPQLPSPQPASAPAATTTTTTTSTPVDTAPGSASAVLMAPPVADIAPMPSAPAASAPGAAASVPSATTAAAPMPVASAAPPSNALASGTLSASTAAAGALQIRAHAASWVEVRDAKLRVLIGRTVAPGEVLLLDGAPPLRVKIGNARETEVSFRGQALDLSTSTSNNVARLELK